MSNLKYNKDESDIHSYFGLSYSNYLVLQRSILQSMPEEWQAKFVDMLEELEEKSCVLKDKPTSFWVRAKINNKFAKDNYSNYERGRRQVFKINN